LESFGKPVDAILHVDSFKLFLGGKPGSTKSAHKATLKLLEPSATFPSQCIVAVKRAITLPKRKTFQVLDKQAALVSLTTEATCLKFAHSLLQMGYAFINRELKSLGAPPFTIPQLHFVSFGIFVSSLGSPEGESGVYLVEEYIDELETGVFQKFINNDKVIPLLKESDSDKDTAEFLAFMQHVQWLKTAKLAFTSDFQGVSFTEHILPKCLIRSPY
jgi:hypothetical protein